MRKYFWLILILFVGTLLRYYNNLDISLWHDEAFSALLIKYNWGEMMHRIGLDVHPPMYYIFLRVWRYALGDSLLSLRSFSVFFSVGAIWAAWLLVKEAFKSSYAALLTAALIAFNPFQIQYATEARMYTMGAFFALLAAYFLVKALHYQVAMEDTEAQHMPHPPAKSNPDDNKYFDHLQSTHKHGEMKSGFGGGVNLPETINGRKKMVWNYVGFILSIIIMIYTHYYLLFAAAAICLYGLIYLFFHHRFDKKAYIPLLTSYFLILASYLPWLKTFLFQYGQVGSGYWIPPMDKWSIPSTLYTLIAGFGHDVSQPNVQKLLVAATMLFLVVLYRFLRKTQAFHKWLVLFVSLAPFAGALLFLVLAKLKGSGSSVYLARYFIFTGAFLSIMAAVWLSQFKNKWLSLILASCFLILNAWAFINYWNDLGIKNRPGMNGAAKYLKANIEPGHRLYSGSSFVFFNLRYYASQLGIDQRPLLFSGGNGDINNLPHFAGTAILTNDDLLPDFSRGLRSGDTVWLVWTNGFGSSKPQIPSNWAQITEKEYPEVRPYAGANVYVSEYKVN